MSNSGLALRALAASLMASLLAACSGGLSLGDGSIPPSANPNAAKVSVWASSADAARKLSPMAGLPLNTDGPAAVGEIVVNPTQQDQEVVGFGAAMTDASALLFQNTLNRAERDELFADLFGSKGLALSFLRVPMGASDFSTHQYSLDDMPAGSTDPELRHFSMAEVRAAQLPALHAAKKVNPSLELMASPWSAPGWMKSTGSLIKGQLKAEHYGALARYFVRYLDAMDAAGLPVRYVSAQNEPAFEPVDYPGMRFSAADRARFFAQNLGPALAARRRPVRILDWDHNWDMPQEPLTVLGDLAAAPFVAGVAWHCYGGKAQAMAQVHAAYPAKQVFFTECSGGDWAPDWGSTLGWMTDNLIIEATRAGSKGTILWNLALDQNRGPHLGGCDKCRAVVTIDTATHQVTRNVEYYVLGHVSHFVHRGAHAVASSGGPAGVTHAAFRNADGSLVLVVHNGGGTATSITIRSAGQSFTAKVPAGEVMTFTWAQSG